jgi:signal peptidase I
MNTEKSQKDSLLQSLSSNLGLIVIVLFVFTFIIQNFVIPSSSMASTLLVGDHVLVDRATVAPPTSWMHLLPYREIQRDEPIVFKKPTLESSGPEAGTYMTLVKRIVAIPGDRIHLREGILYRNGVAINEPYAAKPKPGDDNPYRDNFPALPATEAFGVTAEWAVTRDQFLQGDDLVVPPGHYFVMGDNRPISLDSRYWGFVPRENIIGRPLVISWSIATPENPSGEESVSDFIHTTLYEIAHLTTNTRWGRTLKPVR